MNKEEALSSKTRIRILKELAKGRKTLTQLSKTLSLSKPTLLEHLRLLEEAGLVMKIDEGRKWKYYTLGREARAVPYMGRLQLIILIGVIIIGVLALIMLQPIPEAGREGSYITALPEEDWGIKVSVDYGKGKETINDDGLTYTFTYVCCANLTYRWEIREGWLIVYIDNEGDFCKCPADYTLQITWMKKPKGVRVYGIKYKDIYDYDLMYEKRLGEDLTKG